MGTSTIDSLCTLLSHYGCLLVGAELLQIFDPMQEITGMNHSPITKLKDSDSNCEGLSSDPEWCNLDSVKSTRASVDHLDSKDKGNKQIDEEEDSNQDNA